MPPLPLSWISAVYNDFMALYQSEATCWLSVNKQHCHVGPFFFSSTDFPTCLISFSLTVIDGIKYGLQKMQCKNRPWDLLIPLHIVRRNIACFCKAVQVTRHNLFHQLNHNKVLNKKYNIYFFKPIQHIIGKLPQCVCLWLLQSGTTDFTICTKISWS